MVHQAEVNVAAEHQAHAALGGRRDETEDEGGGKREQRKARRVGRKAGGVPYNYHYTGWRGDRSVSNQR